MALKLMYITNRPEIAQIAESAGVDRIFVDMEYIGKAERQGGMDTVQLHHTVEDVATIKNAITAADLVVRVNPIHNETPEYCSSKEEIDEVIASGADIIMLPYFKIAEEVSKFVEYVDGRVKTLPLVETVEAVEQIDEILEIEGIDEIFIGLNDLSIGYQKKFMFELLTDGTVEHLCHKFKKKGIPYGFGGIASIGKGMLPSEYVIKEHYRLGSTCSILSRSFCNIDMISHYGVISSTFVNGIRDIRALESECQKYVDYFKENHREIEKRINKICGY